MWGYKLWKQVHSVSIIRMKQCMILTNSSFVIPDWYRRLEELILRSRISLCCWSIHNSFEWSLCYRISSYLCCHIHLTFKYSGKFAVSNECPQDWPAQLIHDQMHPQVYKDSGAYFLQVNGFSSELLLKNTLLKYTRLSQWICCTRKFTCSKVKP